jgi:hypothetical protein
MLTVMVLCAIAAMLVAANLSFDLRVADMFVQKSYGWPFIWHRFVFKAYEMTTIGWYWSPARLAGNITIWLAILGGSMCACELLLRRFWPRPRWSLRAMLAAVALAASVCGWFAAAWERAKVQDELFAALPAGWGFGFLVERWGPKWFDLIGFDRFRRSIVYGRPSAVFHAGDEKDERLIKLMARLPKLRSLEIEIDRLSPEMAAAVNGMRQLRSLRLQRLEAKEGADSPDARLPPIGGITHLQSLVLGNMVIDEETAASLRELRMLKVITWKFAEPQIWHDFLLATSKVRQLECLEMCYMTIDSRSLACLENLTNLKALSFDQVKTENGPFVSHLPPLARLETLDLAGSDIGDRDLDLLHRFPRLRTLGLRNTSVSVTGLAELASLESLEELALDGEWAAGTYISIDGFHLLGALKNLRRLHLGRLRAAGVDDISFALDDGNSLDVPESSLADFRQALELLRESHPGIIIDGDMTVIDQEERNEDPIRSSNEAVAIRPSEWVPASGHAWLSASERAEFEADGGWASFEGAGRRENDGSVTQVKF